MPPNRTLVRALALAASAFGFLFAIDLISGAGAELGRATVERVLTLYGGSVAGFCIGLLATSLFQSSSATTSIVVALVAAGLIPLQLAVAVILGANVGTTLTSTLAAFGSSTLPREFARSLSAAAIHDLFNLTIALILLPLEALFGVVSAASVWLADDVFASGSGVALPSLPIPNLEGPPWLRLLGGIALLIGSLRLGIEHLRTIVLARSEQFMEPRFTRQPIVTFAAGLGLTSVVQSSSLTTSFVVPLAGAGLWRAKRVLPFILGANLGTTVTALLAALSTGGPTVGAALTAASAHLFVNLTGVILVALVTPVRRMILKGAEAIGRAAESRRRAAFYYVLSMFFVIPALVLGVMLLTSSVL
jgi:sodium-dependent phosphate cotransporter